MGEFDFTGELKKLDDWEMPETKGGAHCGNGCAPPFVSINREGGIMFMGTLVEVYEPVWGVNLKALPEE